MYLRLYISRFKPIYGKPRPTYAQCFYVDSRILAQVLHKASIVPAIVAPIYWRAQVNSIHWGIVSNFIYYVTG